MGEDSIRRDRITCEFEKLKGGCVEETHYFDGCDGVAEELMKVKPRRGLIYLDVCKASRSARDQSSHHTYRRDFKFT